MKCPICRKPVAKENPEFPFCSDRCRLIDLGKWSSEEYVVSTPIHPQDLVIEPERKPPEDDEG